MWTLLNVEANTGMTMAITESFAMAGVGVSGLYFAHPRIPLLQPRQIGRDQVEDYFARKSFTLTEAERPQLRPSRIAQLADSC